MCMVCVCVCVRVSELLAFQLRARSFKESSRWSLMFFCGACATGRCELAILKTNRESALCDLRINAPCPVTDHATTDQQGVTENRSLEPGDSGYERLEISKLKLPHPQLHIATANSQPSARLPFVVQTLQALAHASDCFIQPSSV